MKDQMLWIEQKALSFLGELSTIMNKAIELKEPKIINENDTILEFINNNLTEDIILFDISLDTKANIIGGWGRSDYSIMIGTYLDDWININFSTGEVEVHNPDYYYLDLFYKIAKNEECFMECLLELAREFKEIEAIKGDYEYNLRYYYDITKRRCTAEKFTHLAGGEDYYRFWSEYWIAWSDQEIFEAGPIGYVGDLPDTLKQEGDKYVWV